ncbi:MAG TPA: hypothetical protein VFB32_12205 [Rudaea sp.]|nr:hypothetical protein [Rudaea sp.]
MFIHKIPLVATLVVAAAAAAYAAGQSSEAARLVGQAALGIGACFGLFTAALQAAERISRATRKGDEAPRRDWRGTAAHVRRLRRWSSEAITRRPAWRGYAPRWPRHSA